MFLLYVICFLVVNNGDLFAVLCDLLHFHLLHFHLLQFPTFLLMYYDLVLCGFGEVVFVLIFLCFV